MAPYRWGFTNSDLPIRFLNVFVRPPEVDDLVGKTMGEAKDRIGGLQPLFEVGNQKGREKISESRLRRKN